MLATWSLSSFPRCEYHVFLSHCAEDREWLVYPLYEALRKRGLIPWIDRHHYPAGADPYAALREEIVHSRHVVYLVTLAMLDQARGWAVLEKSYAGLFQEVLRVGTTELCRIELPLFFLPRDHATLPRSVWQPMISRGSFHEGPRSGEPIEWAAQQIEKFVLQEENRGLILAQDLENDPSFRNHPGLIDRISATYPLRASAVP